MGIYREASHAAREFLRQELADGPQPAGQMLARAAEHGGFSVRTLRGAKRDLGVISERHGGVWFWKIASKIAKHP